MTSSAAGSTAGLASVRYLVDDVDAAVDFYVAHFGFTVRLHFSGAFAYVVRGPLRLLLEAAGLEFRSELVSGPGGQQFLVADPAGNLVELFEPRD